MYNAYSGVISVLNKREGGGNAKCNTLKSCFVKM